MTETETDILGRIADLANSVTTLQGLVTQLPRLATQPAKPEPNEPSTEPSMMPGGVDSAPVANEPSAAPSPIASIETHVEGAVHVAETEGLDLLKELADGKPVKEITSLLESHEGALLSIVKAIFDIAQGVRI